MRSPVIAVTGPIAAGKTTVARIMAARGGALIDCDRLARGAYGDERFKGKIRDAFGGGLFTPAGDLSRKRLSRFVFAGDGRAAELDRLIRPFVSRIIHDEVRSRRKKAPYIVLDAVLFFEYKFRFKVDLVVLVSAAERTRLGRLVRRDGCTLARARSRVEGQRHLYAGWEHADVVIETGGSVHGVEAEATALRDRFLEGFSTPGRKQPWNRE